MHTNTYHIGLWRYGREFYLAAEAVRGDDTETVSIPLYYLYGHAIELTLKAFLNYTGSDERELKSFRHNLTAAMKEAVKKGLGQNMKNLNEVRITIEAINPYYQGKELEYITHGLARFPTIVDMRGSSASLLCSVGKAINIPVAHINRIKS